MNFDYKKLSEEVFNKNFWPRFFIVILSILLLAINYNLFLLHNNLVIGGTSGLATIVYEIVGLNPAIFIFSFNIVFIIISFIFLGPKNTGLTIIGSLLYPLFVSLTSAPCEYIANKLVFDNFFLIVIISGFLFGIANGFIYKTGYSTGGADIAIQLVNKYLKIPTGVSSLIINSIVIIAGGLIFGISKAIYAIIVIVINSQLVDKIMLGISDSKMFYIHTKKIDEVKDFINKMHSGCTIMRTEGGYTNEEKDLIMCVVPTKDYYMFKNVLTKIDPDSFLIISDCYEVYGGYRKEKYPFI